MGTQKLSLSVIVPSQDSMVNLSTFNTGTPTIDLVKCFFVNSSQLGSACSSGNISIPFFSPNKDTICLDLRQHDRQVIVLFYSRNRLLLASYPHVPSVQPILVHLKARHDLPSQNDVREAIVQQTLVVGEITLCLCTQLPLKRRTKNEGYTQNS